MKRVALLLAITFIACKTSTHETNQKKTNPETTETQSETKVSPKSESEVIKKIEPKEVLSIVCIFHPFSVAHRQLTKADKKNNNRTVAETLIIET